MLNNLIARQFMCMMVVGVEYFNKEFILERLFLKKNKIFYDRFGARFETFYYNECDRSILLHVKSLYLTVLVKNKHPLSKANYETLHLK